MQQSSRATPPAHFAHVGPGGLKCSCCAPQTQRHKRPYFRTAKRRQRRDEQRFELKAERAMLLAVKLETKFAEAVGHKKYRVEQRDANTAKVLQGYIDEVENPGEYWFDPPFFRFVATITYDRALGNDPFGEFVVERHNEVLARLPASENSFDTAAQYVIALHRMGALE